MVKVGMISVNGKASSTKFITAPVAPNLPPKDLKNIKAERGAHMTSLNSPTPGKAKLKQPIRSITIQNVREGTVVVCSSVFMANFYTNTMQFFGFDRITVLIFKMVEVDCGNEYDRC